MMIATRISQEILNEWRVIPAHHFRWLKDMCHTLKKIPKEAGDVENEIKSLYNIIRGAQAVDTFLMAHTDNDKDKSLFEAHRDLKYGLFQAKTALNHLASVTDLLSRMADQNGELNGGDVGQLFYLLNLHVAEIKNLLPAAE